MLGMPNKMKSRILRNLSKNGNGLNSAKSKLKAWITVDSILMTVSLLKSLSSSSGSNLSIRLIDGVIGYSSLAAIIVTVGNRAIS